MIADACLERNLKISEQNILSGAVKAITPVVIDIEVVIRTTEVEEIV